MYKELEREFSALDQLCSFMIKRFDRVKVHHIEVLRLNIHVHSWHFDIHGYNIFINQIRAIQRVEIRKMYTIARLADQIYISIQFQRV